MAIYGNMVVPSKASAGALPTDNSDRNVYVPGGEVSGRFSDAGVQIAAQGAQQATQALGNLGRGIGQLGGMFVDIYERNRRLDMAKAEEAYARLQIEGTEERTRLSRLKGANAIGADGKTLDVEAQWRDWYTKAKARHAQGLGDAGLRYFNLHADQFNAHQAAGVHSYFEQQLGQYEDAQLKFAMDAEGSALAANPFDSASAAASQGRIRGLIHQQAMRNGWSAEMEAQAYQAAVGRMWSNAIAIQISQGQFGNAQQLLQQHGAALSADDVAKLNTSYNSGVIQYANNLAQAGNWQGLEQLQAGMVQGTGWNQGVAAEAARRRGTPYKFGSMNDCSGYQTQLWGPYIQDPAVRAKLFPGGRGTSEGIVVEAAKLTQGGRMLGNAELAPGHVGPGMVIGIDSGPNRHAYDNRPNGIDHIVSTYAGPDGRIWVTEASGGKEGKVHDTPYDEWYASNSGKKLYGATLVPLLRQGGAPAGEQGVPAGWKEYNGERKTLPERQHNPGAVKPPSGYSTFSSDAEGFLAQAKVLRTDKYYAGKNIKDLVLTYVGYNPPASYWAKIKEAGFRLDEVPNRSDNRVLSRLMIALAKGESPLGNQYSPEQVEALLNGGAQSQPQQQASAQAPAPVGKLSDNAQAIYNMWQQNVQAGYMTHQQAVERLQENLRSLKAKMSSSDEAVRNMAKGDYKDTQDALAALQQSQQPAQAQAHAPVSAQTQQPAMPQAGGAPMLGLYATPSSQAHVQALRARGMDSDAARLKQGLPDAEYRAKTTGNCQDLEDIAGGLRALGKNEDADKVQRAADLYKANEQARQAAVTMPLPQLFEQVSVLAKQLNPDTAKDMSAETHQQVKAQYDLLSDIARTRMEALKADPAQAADQDSYSGIAPEMNIGDKVRGRLDYQAKQGLGEITQRMLTKAEAETLRGEWVQLPSESKAAKLEEWKKTFGENAPRILGEIGIGSLEQDIASAVMDSKEKANVATEAFRIASLTPKEVPGFEQIIDEDVRATLEGSEVYNAYKKQAQATLDDASLAIMQDMKNFAKKCMKLGKSSKEVQRLLDLGRESYIGDNAAIVIPKGMSESQFDLGLEWASGEPLREFLKAGRPDLSEKNAIFGVEDEVRRLRSYGLWIASPFGDGFILMDSTTHKPVVDNRGKIFTVTKLQIENHAERRGQGEAD